MAGELPGIGNGIKGVSFAFFLVPARFVGVVEPHSYLKVAGQNGFAKYNGRLRLRDVLSITLEGLPPFPSNAGIDTFRSNEVITGFVPNIFAKNMLFGVPVFMNFVPFSGFLGCLFLLIWPQRGRAEFRQNARARVDALWRGRYPIILRESRAL